MNHLTEDILIQYAFDLLETAAKAEAAAHLADCAECRGQLEQIRAKFAVLDVLEADEAVSDELMGKILSAQQRQDVSPPISTSVGSEHTETPPSGGLRRSALKPWLGWITAAAAMLVVGLLVMMDREPETTVTQRSPQKTAADAPATERPAAKDNDVMVAAKPSDEGVMGIGSSFADNGDLKGNHPALTAPVLDKEESLLGDKKTELTETKAERRKSPDGISDSDIAGTLTSQSGDLRPAALTSRTTPPLRALRLRKEGSLVRVVSADEIPDVAPFAPASAIELVVLPRPDTTQVTIYNSADLTLVRDTRKLTLKPGWNWLQFMWDNTQIDPTSLSLRPLAHEGHVDIELISYPARLKDIGRWLIRSEVEGAVPFEITYFASGLSWRAFYMGTMNADETSMDLKGYVNVCNYSGQDFANTQTRLIVGETRLIEEIGYLAGRQYPYGPEIVVDDNEGADKYNWKSVPIIENPPVLGRYFSNRSAGDMGGFGGGAVYFDSAGFKVKEIIKAGLSEYFLYTIEGTENLTNQWSRRLPSLDVTNIPIESLYKYDEDRYGNQTVRFVSFANDTEHELGETPIPEGAIKIYRNLNEAQNLAYVGGSDFKYIPVNEDVELNLGAAQLVKVEPILMDHKTDNYLFNNKGNIDGWDDIETWQVKVTNTRDIPVDIEITRNFETTTWEIEVDPPAKAERRESPDGSSESDIAGTETSQSGDLRPAALENRTTPPLRAPLLGKEGSFNDSPPAKGEYREAGRGSSFEYKKHDKTRGRFTMTVQPQSEKSFGYTVTKYRGRREEVLCQETIEIEPRIDTNLFLATD